MNFNTLTVYLGSSGNAPAHYKKAAQELGAMIAKNGKALVYGGMDAGLMGLLAAEALKAGGHVTGIVPRKLKDSERILDGLSETILVEDLWERKRRMFMQAGAVIALPGGFGTLDESLEVLYWGYLGLHDKPLVLVNIEGYWDDLIGYIRTLPDFDERYLIVSPDVVSIFPALEQWSGPEAISEVAEHLPHFEDEVLARTNEPLITRKSTVENTYKLITALGLKQLDKHQRRMGILNDRGQFDGLLAWFKRAAKDHFITAQCLKLYDVAAYEKSLQAALAEQPEIHIDLHGEKWGPGVEKD